MLSESSFNIGITVIDTCGDVGLVTKAITEAVQYPDNVGVDNEICTADQATSSGSVGK